MINNKSTTLAKIPIKRIRMHLLRCPNCDSDKINNHFYRLKSKNNKECLKLKCLSCKGFFVIEWASDDKRPVKKHKEFSSITNYYISPFTKVYQSVSTYKGKRKSGTIKSIF